jgi:hypothetical protein
MSDNEMDDIIRKAASEYHPPYNDKSWQRMEQLLDKHLPVQKERSYRALYLLFLLLLIGAGTYFGIVYFSSEKKSSPILAGNNNKTESENTTTITNSATHPNSDNANSQISSKKGNIISIDNSVNGNSTLKTSGSNDNSLASGTTSKPKVNNLGKVRSISFRNRTNVIINNADADKDVAKKDDNAEEVVKNELKSDKTQKAEVAVNSDTKKDDIKKEETKKDDLKKETSTGQVAKAKTKKKEKNSFANSFGISLSIGPDVSFVRVKDMGTITANYGVGLSYKLSNHFTVQSGFYSSNKIYAADSADYHPPKQFMAYYPRLDNIYANCNIYEIPVLVTYNFKSSGKHNWLLTTGVSSFLMHTETYKYAYGYGSAQVISRPYTISNQNKHYFSVLTLSGGYEYKLNKAISFNLSPYLKIPLAGVGYGKVKLNSTGMLFTITAKPFAKK